MSTPAAPSFEKAPPTAAGGAPLLRIADLGVTFASAAGPVHAVREVSLDLHAGQVTALVGESGSGKSVTALTLLGLTRDRGTTVTGSAMFDGVDLVTAPDRTLQGIRGKRIAMVFQDALSALNPVYRVGAQIAEAIQAHEQVGKAEARRRAVEALAEVGIPQASERADAYPHEFSGGMRQRVMIAMALSCQPELLLADEPTTALDVTVQAQILDLLLRLKEERGMGVLIVTHDLGVVAETADRVAVMYGGRIVEEASCEDLFADPLHPYTWGLLGSVPPIDGPKPERLPAIAGAPPSPTALPDGCSFRSRCPHEFSACTGLPSLEAATTGAGDRHADRCWLPDEQARAVRHVGEGRIGLAPKPAPAGDHGRPA
ncbi:MAG: ABC transporter ATP-binding protein [Solirubrobacteraceae bacterium]|nr:ABC transporter ATP-binding protein [Solirubrobacteraceae bacterium]